MPNPPSRYFVSLKILSLVVLVLMAAAIVYAAIISFQNWGGINV